MKIEDVHSEVIHIWEKYPISNRVPIFYPDLKQEALLFIGLNPSFDEKELKRILKGTEYEYILSDLHGYFDVKNFTTEKIKELVKIDQQLSRKHNYFSEFKKFSEELNIEWEHIDLLFMRETTQKEVEKLLKTKRDFDFIERQIELTVKIINKVKPKIIVIANAFASKILKEKLNLKFYKNIGTYLYESERFKIPVFLSSMLTGRRALDIGSRERLKWHLKLVRNKFK